MVDAQGIRPIKQVWKSEPTLEGAGVHFKRAFGFRNPDEQFEEMRQQHLTGGKSQLAA